MDDIRGSLSKMKKKVKHRLTERKRKLDGTGANPGGKGADSTSSLPQPDPHVVAGKSYVLEGDRADAAGGPFFSTDQPPQPEPVSARGSDNGQEEGETDIDGGEPSRMHCSHQHPGVDIAVGSEPSGELEGVYPSPSTPSILRGGKPDST